MNSGCFCLGLDASTQSLTATLIDPDREVITGEETVVYDRDLPGYSTENGVIQKINGAVHSPPLMWADALDLLFARLRDSGVPLERVEAVSGSGQQHGSVYLNSSFESAAGSLDPGRSIAEQMENVFTRPASPVWMDSSTGEECREIEHAAGGAEQCIRITGSPVFRRFTGPQIRKFFKEDPDAYRDTVLIQLVSSFMASLLAGKPVSTDPGDGAGTAMMDIRTKQWSQEMLDAAAPDLSDRLLPVAPSDTSAGTIAPYFAEKYGFPRTCEVVLFSGDNPCSLIGAGLVSPGRICISLGTSDTLFSCMKTLRTSPRGEGVVFGAPTGDYMSLLCMRNGSLARERIRDMYGLDWNGFSECLRSTPPGNNGRCMLPWFEQEIYPPLKGVKRFNLPEDCVCENVRAVVEAQAAALRIHSKWMEVPADTLYLTGGASVNREISRVFADMFQASVYRFETSNSASLGAALRALFRLKRSRGEQCSWEETVKPFAQPVEGSEVLPDPSVSDVYGSFCMQYSRHEQEAITRV